MDYVKSEPLVLKNHPEFDEKWIQDQLAEDSGLLGLGDIELLDRERAHNGAGRLDLLYRDAGGRQRFEVEVQLGSMDESHIMRCIEYWDIERRRYPAYDHVAVLVAESVTARFLNLLTLFAGSIPLVVIQMQAFKVGDKISLTFIKVIDQRQLRTDDAVASAEPAKDRAYWEGVASKSTVAFIDPIIEKISELAGRELKPNYNKHYIGLLDGKRANNFVYFIPKKKFTHVTAKVLDTDNWVERLEEVGLTAASNYYGELQLTLRTGEYEANSEIIHELLQAALANKG